MKSINFSSRSFHLVALSLLTLTIVSWDRAEAQDQRPVPGQETHGGDVFDTVPGDTTGIKFWDFVEYGDSFHPLEVEGAGAILKARLDGLQKKAPSTMKALRNLANQSVWSFVEPKLKDQPPTGDSNLILSYQRIQAALSVPSKLSVQINKSIWTQLNPTAQAFLLMHELLWLAEKSPVLYLEINPNLAVISETPQLSASGGISVNAAVLSSSNKSPLFLTEISTTSSDIRRITGYLMNPSVAEGPEVTGADILSFLKTTVGRVHTAKPLSFEISRPKAKFLPSDFSGNPIEKPATQAASIYEVEDVASSLNYRGWVISTESEKKDIRSDYDLNDIIPLSHEGKDLISVKVSKQSKNYKERQTVWYIERTYSLTYATFSEISALGTMAVKELPYLVSKLNSDRDNAMAKQFAEKRKTAINQRIEEGRKCNQNLPTTLNRFIEGFNLWSGSEAIMLVTPKYDAWDVDRWNPELNDLILYFVPSKIEDSDLHARPYAIVVRPDLSCEFRVQSEVFIERLRNSKEDKIYGSEKMNVLQADMSVYDGKLHYSIHLEDKASKKIIQSKKYSIPLVMTVIK